MGAEETERDAAAFQKDKQVEGRRMLPTGLSDDEEQEEEEGWQPAALPSEEMPEEEVERIICEALAFSGMPEEAKGIWRRGQPPLTLPGPPLWDRGQTPGGRWGPGRAPPGG